MPNESDLKAEIGHVLFIDIVGYSKLLINEQSELLEHLIEMVRRSEQVRRADAERKLIRLATGDGMALVFRNSLEAPVQCALELARADKQHPELQLRMGIHSGPINEVTDVNERANVTGAGINLAQRVMDCGDAGHILLSRRVADDLAQYRHWQPHLHELGECEVKHGVRLGLVNLYTDDVGNPALPSKLQSKGKPFIHPGSRWPLLIAAVVVLFSLGGAIWWFATRSSGPLRSSASGTREPRISKKSIAVLPFENLSEDKANAYFADGMQDEIITRLAKIGDLRVIARSSTLRYKTKPEDLSVIQQQLGVANFLEGTVQKVGDRVRINVQLIRAGANDHLWAEIYDRNLSDIFAVQTEVAMAIADSLQLKLSGRERTAVLQKPTDNLAAYEAYLRGLDLVTRPNPTVEDQIKAADQFQEAVRLDPNFVEAWAALSRVDSYLYIIRVVEGGSERAEMARRAAETATRLAPALPETLLANAYYRYLVQRDYEAARLVFEKVHEQLPSNSEALAALALVARRQNRWKDSLRLFEAASKVNPRDVSLLTDRATTFRMVRQSVAAHQTFDRALEISPGDFDLLAAKADLFLWEGKLPAAKSIIDQLASAPQTDDMVQLRVGYLNFCRSYAEAETLLLEVLASKASRVDFSQAEFRASLGWVQSWAGEKEKGQETFRQAKNELEAVQRDQPSGPLVAEVLGNIEAGLGDKEAALRAGERGVALWPASEDPVYGPSYEELLAGIEALVGEPERALGRIERLLTTPYWYPINQASLRLDPTWDNLRSLPRFKAIVEGPEPKTIFK